MFAILEFTTLNRQLSASTHSRKSTSDHQLAIDADPVRILFRYPEAGTDWKADKLLDVASGFVTLHSLSNEIANGAQNNSEEREDSKRCTVFESVCEIGIIGESGKELTVNVAMCSAQSPVHGSVARLVVFLLALPDSVATRTSCARRLTELLRFIDSRFADLPELRIALGDTNVAGKNELQPPIRSSALRTFNGVVERVCEYEFGFEEVVVPSDARKTFDALIEENIAASAPVDGPRLLFGALVFSDQKLLHNHGVANETLYAVWRTLRLDNALRSFVSARGAGELVRVPLYLDRLQITDRGRQVNAGIGAGASSLSFSRSSKMRFTLVVCNFNKLELCCLFSGDSDTPEPITLNALRRTTLLFDSYLKQLDPPCF